MDTNFAQSLKLVLIDEGGLDDDPHDHGGRTAHGIIQREFTAWLTKQGLPNEDVWKISPDQLSTIYHDQYWEPECDYLPCGLDYAFFDFAVNAGQTQATRTLQRALNAVGCKLAVDGDMGVITKNAILANSEPAKLDALVKEYCQQRRAFYESLAQFPRYGKGWMARTDHVQTAALHMIVDHPAERPALTPDLKAQATAKANPADVSKPPVSAATTTIVGTLAAAAAGISAQLNQLTGTISGISSTIPHLSYILVGIAVVSAVFGIVAVIHEAEVKKVV